MSNGCIEFFVFNPKLSKREDDEDNKILFFHPSTENQGVKHKEIGLCEAVIYFAMYKKTITTILINIIIIIILQPIYQKAS